MALFEYLKTFSGEDIFEFDDLLSFQDIANALNPFEGWSLCVTVEDAEKWEAKVKRELPVRIDATSKKPIGQKLRAAVEDHSKIFPKGRGNYAWKAVVAEIYKATGNLYSQGTLTRAIKVLNDLPELSLDESNSESKIP